MTPLERAVIALEAELQRQHSEDNLSHFLRRDHGSDWVTTDGNIDLTPVVRAVLTAIREPSEAMIDAGHDSLSIDIAGNPLRSEIEPAWVAMIDAAMAEG